MKQSHRKTEAKEKIQSHFQKKTFTPAETKKIKRLAMKHNIKLKENRKLFCKKCLSQLKGKTRVTKTHKTIECSQCHHKNKFKIK